MSKTFQLSTAYCRSTLLSGGVLLGLLLAGCGEAAPQLEATVTSPVGRPGVCAQCDEKISTVAEAHLITVGGVEYIVCDDQCAADLKKWLAEQ